ncbi:MULTISPECIES: SAV_6107 family HEPN domain-containing protein [unclassified Gordonia (in: high G+C Gram-positive bacteria)]|uniref:SAV_6107 family HEPN domain-containing protein n=1 Tax=unclassified Gordonia (in: high G+C Gram-positive bacteria) TaxID=2657482 RepID=UPI001F0F896E|nr:SAV_6107 family HEPN domain-containing protein [Gordonia sp. ABSL49_1]MCH5644529.1 SAV_6107 family HEPN domain-containing protein [Gordonia sp. ABSL49_1]
MRDRRSQARRRSVPAAGRVAADPIVVGRARDLLDRAHILFDNADGVPDDPERFRQYYLAALRAAGAALAVHELPGRPRRGATDAWSRTVVVVPELAREVQVFASLSATRMRIESGIVRTIDPRYVAAMRVAVTGFLQHVEAHVIAYEQGRVSQGNDSMGRTA